MNDKVPIAQSRRYFVLVDKFWRRRKDSRARARAAASYNRVTACPYREGTRVSTGVRDFVAMSRNGPNEWTDGRSLAGRVSAALSLGIIFPRYRTTPRLRSRRTPPAISATPAARVSLPSTRANNNAILRFLSSTRGSFGLFSSFGLISSFDAIPRTLKYIDATARKWARVVSEFSEACEFPLCCFGDLLAFGFGGRSYFLRSISERNIRLFEGSNKIWNIEFGCIYSQTALSSQTVLLIWILLLIIHFLVRFKQLRRFCNLRRNLFLQRIV